MVRGIFECTVEAEFLLRMQRFQAIHALALEHFFKHSDR
jgi:hypothetical protein